MKISMILDKIDENQLFVPAFQREYVWKREDAKLLMDSLIKDYPTGTMLTWETNNPPELKGGHVYDVNLFKRNLLQDTMVAYKAELFKLLNSPRSNEQEISDKLSALVEGSPVRTTSDSNLLEGTWALAYSTFSTAKSSFFLIRYQSSVVSPHAFVSHSLNFFFFSSFQALVCEKSSRVWKSATDSQKQQFRLSQNTCHEADRRQRIALLVCGQIIFSRRTR